MKKTDKKTEKKTKTPKKREPMSPTEKLTWKIILLFIILGSILWALILGAKALYKAVCTENSNYILRNVEVISNGYWNGKDKYISAYLKLSLRKNNIFSLDLEKLRQNALRSIPGVKACEVRRILPDTIQFNLIERVPRAKISGHNSYLVDETGTILPKKYSMISSRSLPLITGVNPRRRFKVNRRERDFFNAMQILLLTLRYYSDIEIIAVDISDKDFLKFYVRYAKGRLRQAIMPNSLSGIDLRLKALRTALIRSHTQNDAVKIYNLSFEGRIVCQ